MSAAAMPTARLGKKTSHGESSMYFCPVIDNIPPHEGTSGGVPTPRKLSAASTTTAYPQIGRGKHNIGGNAIGHHVTEDQAPGSSADRTRRQHLIHFFG